jgi:predicted nicotinamide N-methyase
MPPRFHATPLDAIGAVVRETVEVGGCVFQIERPADPAATFAHPAVRAVNAVDEYLPHWVRLWPAARMLAEIVLQESWDKFPKNVAGSPQVLELGCGLGVAGLAALARGQTVAFSDIDETALQFATNNARLNGFDDFSTLLLDLRSPPEGVKYPIVIGSDLIYQDRLVRPLVALLQAVLAPGGVCLLVDPDRPDGKRFRFLLVQAGFAVSSTPARLNGAGGDPIRGTLDRITFPVRRETW